MYRHRTTCALPIGFLIAALCATSPSSARAEAQLLVDVDSGKVLHAEDAARAWHPASVTKLMTLYTTLHAVKEGRITLDTPTLNSLATWCRDCPLATRATARSRRSIE